MLPFGVVLATVAAFIVSAVFYAVAPEPAPASPAAPVRPPVALVVVELAPQPRRRRSRRRAPACR